MRNYVAIIRKNSTSDYGVDFPDFQGCISAGATIEEAVTLGREALADHVAVMTEYGEEIPRPTDADTILSSLRNRDDFVALFLAPVSDATSKSIRVNISVPEASLRRIDRYVRSHGTSRSAFLVEASLKALQK